MTREFVRATSVKVVYERRFILWRPGSAGKALAVEAPQRRKDRVSGCPRVTSSRLGGGRRPGGA